MNRSHVEDIKSLLNDMYGLADTMEGMGIHVEYGGFSQNDRLRKVMETDILYFALRIIEKDRMINEDAKWVLCEYTGKELSNEYVRLLGRIYSDTGILSEGHLVEVSRAELVAKYVGQTAPKVKEIFEKAKGGILFIDEAYMLTREEGDFGVEALETLLKLMEDNREDIVVIAAGYPEQMQEFMDANPGLRSRFPSVLHFPDYTEVQLYRIFCQFCQENSIQLSRRVDREVRINGVRPIARNPHCNGNAREVRNLFEKMLMNQASRLVETNVMERRELCEFTYDDLPWVAEKKEGETPLLTYESFERFQPVNE